MLLPLGNNNFMSLRLSDLKIGDSFSEQVCKNLSRTQIVQYAGASGDFNPIHHDQLYTEHVAGYPSVFAHGMLTMGMTGKMLTNHIGDGRLISFGVRFTAQVFPGATLTATATVTDIRQENGMEIVDLVISTVDEKNVEVIKGNASARLDP